MSKGHEHVGIHREGGITNHIYLSSTSATTVSNLTWDVRFQVSMGAVLLYPVTIHGKILVAISIGNNEKDPSVAKTFDSMDVVPVVAFIEKRKEDHV